MYYFLLAFKKYAVFSGRASREEYWYFVLFNLISIFALAFIGGIFIKQEFLRNTLFWFYAVGIACPTVAIEVRRLHDIGKSMWWLLVGAIPYIGWLWILILTLQDSFPGDNEYGPNPKEVQTI